MISLNEPYLNGKEKIFVKDTLKKNWISNFGEYNKRFEKSLSKFTKSKNVIAVSSGTAALHLALRAMGVVQHSEVIVPSLTFVASVNVIKYLNAHPVFMDVREDHNLDIKKTIEFLNKKTTFKNNYTFNKNSKRKIIAIIVTHMWGNALDFFDLKKICKKKNIRIIEDAAEALGTFYKKGNFKNKHVGTIGDIGCLSFNGNKIITTGSGGAILTKDRTVAKKIIYLSEQAKNDGIKYIHNEVGYNYRLSNINSAFGLGQMSKINVYLKRKKFNYQYYKYYIDKIPGLQILKPNNISKSNHWMNVLKIDYKLIKKKPMFFNKKLLNHGIQTRLVWKPNHLQNMYKNDQKFKITISNHIYDSCLCIPSSVNLDIKKLKKICDIIKKIANA